MQQRIQKIIARTGLASRRGAEALIRQGRVRLNDKLAVLGDKAAINDRIYVDDKEIKTADANLQVLLLNKPEGYITSRKDPQGRKSVFDLLPELTAGRWISVGRLDINTSGLLLFTSDGGFANLLMHPSSDIEREYMCRIYGGINNNKINKLKSGINLKPEMKTAFFKSIREVSSSGRNHWFSVVLTQGRYREVRRLWEAVDCQVSRLSRIRFGQLRLPGNLPKGKYLLLSDAQITAFRDSIYSKKTDTGIYGKC